MKKLVLLFFTLALLSCSSDDARQSNQYLPSISFSVSVNTNLPQYSNLQFAGNAAYFPNAGVRGIFIINTGSGVLAWEASDPNHEPNDCSTMVRDGVEVTCGCEDTTYNLYNGLAVGEDMQYALLAYRTSVSGNIITVSN
ncbi:MAG: hypothetical protein CL868_12390 [Cytophagaceae bacterium]|nr:hypothetical protein [Cytophagaceae bacterium]|tara:strand:+ start:7978 stop:8397 length:420 start_codon:yes stop_codon:yes gene_type:complete